MIGAPPSISLYTCFIYYSGDLLWYYNALGKLQSETLVKVLVRDEERRAPLRVFHNGTITEAQLR